MIFNVFGKNTLGAIPVHNGFFGQGDTLQILADNVACIGNEESLTSCSRSNLNAIDCTHSEDAGVICEGTALDSLSLIQYHEF